MDDLTYLRDLAGLTASLAAPETGDAGDTARTVADRLRGEGFSVLNRSRVIGHGQDDLDHAVQNLLSGRAHRAAGAPVYRHGTALSVVHPLQVGDVLTVTPGRGLLTPLDSSCLVLVAGPTEMVYGTLPGHMECGEERFAVTLDADGTVTASMTAFSRPGNLLTRLAGPVGRAVQTRMADAYISGMAP